MSNCDIEIVFDQHDAVYAVGEKISCTVKVSVNNTVRCDDLKLFFYWKTHGKGNRAKGHTEVSSLFSGEWQPGEYSYQHEFSINSGPLSYHGKLLNVDWYVEASADIPWAFDPKDKKEFYIKRGEHAVSESVVTQVEDQSLQQKFAQFNNSNTTTLELSGKYVKFFFLPFILVPAGIIAASIFSYLDTGDIDLSLILFCMAFLSVALFAAFKVMQNKMAEKKLGPVNFELNKSTFHPEENADIDISFMPQEDVQINAITATLTGTENVRSGSGTNVSHYSDVFYSKAIDVHINPGPFMASRPYNKSVQFMIPSDAAASFHATDNEINWQITLDIDINRCPDWSRSERIKVLF